jgi:Zn-dependent protease
LFRLFGVDVYLHWTWFIVAYFQIQYHPLQYSTPVWKVAEYLTLFLIVLLHEFGHALACRQVGGVANRIVLWPLGGVAYVNPPPRPGAYLWSIAAGPLVNLILFPVTIGACVVSSVAGWDRTLLDLHNFIEMITKVNFALLVFNMLPIYPLDGGQIVRALLWFAIGPVRSLLAVTVIGVIAASGGLVLSLILHQWWMVALALYAVFRSVTGFLAARQMQRVLTAPRHVGIRCPNCGEAPAQGDFWSCGNCRRRFDTFAHGGVCPGCGATFSVTACPNCGEQNPTALWYATVIRTDTTGNSPIPPIS